MKKSKKKIIRESEQFQHKVEKGLDKKLIPLQKKYISLGDEITNLYSRVEKIDKIEVINNRELMIQLNEFKGLFGDLPGELLLYLVFVAFNMGNNKRNITLFLELNKLLLELGMYQLKLMNIYYTFVVDEIFKLDLLDYGIGGISPEEIQEVLRYRIYGMHYSDRVWNNTKALNDKLFDVLSNGLANGLSHSQIANAVSDRLGVGFSSTTRLVQTELNAVYNIALVDYYKMLGVKRVQQISTLDKRTSEICWDRHLAIIDVSTSVIGENIPPLHPYCRSIIIPIID